MPSQVWWDGFNTMFLIAFIFVGVVFFIVAFALNSKSEEKPPKEGH